jgi:hypothetical protein
MHARAPTSDQASGAQVGDESEIWTPKQERLVASYGQRPSQGPGTHVCGQGLDRPDACAYCLHVSSSMLSIIVHPSVYCDGYCTTTVLVDIYTCLQLTTTRSLRCVLALVANADKRAIHSDRNDRACLAQFTTVVSFFF